MISVRRCPYTSLSDNSGFLELAAAPPAEIKRSLFYTHRVVEQAFDLLLEFCLLLGSPDDPGVAEEAMVRCCLVSEGLVSD